MVVGRKYLVWYDWYESKKEEFLAQVSATETNPI
jgi:hypothetical protein